VMEILFTLGLAVAFIFAYIIGQKQKTNLRKRRRKVLDRYSQIDEIDSNDAASDKD
jgi:hypothetical protein